MTQYMILQGLEFRFCQSMQGRLSKLREITKQQGFDIYDDEEKGDFTYIEAAYTQRPNLDGPVTFSN